VVVVSDLRVDRLKFDFLAAHLYNVEGYQELLLFWLALFRWQEHYGLRGISNKDLVTGLPGNDIWQLVALPKGMLDGEVEAFQ
jgi:hypothetical protein